MNKPLFTCLITIAVLVSCVVGPERIKIIMSGLDQPIISWTGGPAHSIRIVLADSMISVALDDSLTGERNPCVWGYEAYTETGEKYDGIVSPIKVGSLIDNASDCSDSLFRQSTLTPRTNYEVYLNFSNHYSVGHRTYRFSAN